MHNVLQQNRLMTPARAEQRVAGAVRALLVPGRRRLRGLSLGRNTFMVPPSFHPV